MSIPRSRFQFGHKFSIGHRDVLSLHFFDWSRGKSDFWSKKTCWNRICRLDIFSMGVPTDKTFPEWSLDHKNETSPGSVLPLLLLSFLKLFGTLIDLLRSLCNKALCSVISCSICRSMQDLFIWFIFSPN